MGARHYDPATGRFLQPDPLGIEAGELYAYAASNPYVYWDPSGLTIQSFAGDAWSGVSGFLGDPTVTGALQDIGTGFSMAAASIFVPGAGELMDAYTLQDPAAASWEKWLAGGSLAVGAVTAGASPNTSGVVHGGRQIAGGVGDLLHAGTKLLPEFAGGAPRGAPMRVLHFTDDVGAEAIAKSGSLRQGTFVTLPRDVPAGSTARQVEELLEIAPGRGQNYIDRFVDPGDLMIPGPEHGGAFTSGGARQFQLLRELEIDPTRFGRTGP
jgi:hypothetical protein